MQKMTLCGYLTRNFELSKTEKGTPYASNVMAITRRKYVDEKTGEVIQESDFIPIIIYGKRAEIAFEYLKKGNKLLAWGELRTWSNKKDDGTYTNHYRVLIQNFEFIDYKNKEKENQDSNQASKAEAPQF